MCGSNRNGCTEINHSKLVLYSALLAFAINWALKLDGFISASFWWVFLPLFIWKALLFCGCLVGSLVWFLSPQLREGRTEFHAMWLCCSLHVQIVLFEVLCCVKLEMGGGAGGGSEGGMEHLSWIIVFTPLLFSTPFAAMCFLWLYRNDRSFILELIHGGSTLFYVFTALKLDHTINWSWGVILLPVWVLMCVVCFVVVYCSCWSLFMLRQMGQDVSSEQRRYYIRFICTGIALLLPLLTFFVLLVSKLEAIWDSDVDPASVSPVNPSDLAVEESASPQMKPASAVVSSDVNSQKTNSNFEIPWLVTMIPLYATLIALISTTLGARGGNRWLFGMRTDLCTFALNVFPFLKEYANISVKLSAASDASFNNSSSWAMSPVLLNLRLAVDSASHERDLNNTVANGTEALVADTEIVTPNSHRTVNSAARLTSSQSFPNDMSYSVTTTAEVAAATRTNESLSPNDVTQVSSSTVVASYHSARLRHSDSQPATVALAMPPVCDVSTCLQVPYLGESASTANMTSSSVTIDSIPIHPTTSQSEEKTRRERPKSAPYLRLKNIQRTTVGKPSPASHSCHQTSSTSELLLPSHSTLQPPNATPSHRLQSGENTKSGGQSHPTGPATNTGFSSSHNPFLRFAHFRKMKNGITFGTTTGSAGHGQSSTCDVIDIAANENTENLNGGSTTINFQNGLDGNEFNQIAIYCPD